MIVFHNNADEFEKKLVQTLDRNIPFAVAQAINDTAFEMRHHTVNVTYPSAFTVRNARFPGVIFKVDEKAPIRGPELSAFRRGGVVRAVFADVSAKGPKRAGVGRYMARHAKGGTKAPYTGGRVAVPNTAGGQIKRSAGGRVPVAQRPKRQLQKKGVFATRNAIMRRKKGKLDVLFGLPSSVKINKSFMFYEENQRIFYTQMPVNFHRRLAVALRH